MRKNYLLILLCILCLSTSFSQEKIEHSYWEWVVGSEISDKRLNEIAPHFPRGDDSQYNSNNYDQAILRWQKLYCFEYEALINAPELTRLNPYYTGYENIIEIPYFIRPLSSYDKPTKKDTGNDFEDQLDYELDLQAWYFVFAPEEFYNIYRIKPTFPEWFDVQAYKDQIIKKIEETKKQEEANK